MESKIVQMLVSGQKDLEWYKKNVKALKEQYNEMFVAIYNESVVDSDKDAIKLVARLRKNKINPCKVLVEFVSKVTSVL
ncbi:MAG: DUF5678 domain-containing protein [Candidatus Woesearchaeota archaeon]